MKKIRRIQLHHAAILPKEQMIGVIGGAGSKSYHYYLRCDQDRPNGYLSVTATEQPWKCIATAFLQFLFAL